MSCHIRPCYLTITYITGNLFICVLGYVFYCFNDMFFLFLANVFFVMFVICFCNCVICCCLLCIVSAIVLFLFVVFSVLFMQLFYIFFVVFVIVFVLCSNKFPFICIILFFGSASHNHIQCSPFPNIISFPC